MEGTIKEIRHCKEVFIDFETTHDDVISEIIKMLLEKNMGYMDMNEVLWLADRTLYKMALERNMRPEGIYEPQENYLPLSKSQIAR